MFKKFCNFYKANQMTQAYNNDFETKLRDLLQKSIGALDFIKSFQGNTFLNGLYRIHNIQDIDKWNDIICEAFPEYHNEILCFGYDWLGRQFAIDFSRIENNEPQIVMFEPGTGQALEIPTSFLDFHENEIINFQEEALAVSFFNDWQKHNKTKLEHHQCVGYKMPLFLGGEDTIDNLEISDIEVYWGICSQLINQTRNVPVGTRIKIDNN